MGKKKVVIFAAILFMIILLIALLIHRYTYEYDKKEIENGNPPVYSFSFIRIKDGGSNVYYGIGYQVLRWHTTLNNGERKVAYEIYKYPNYKEWDKGPEPTTKYFDYEP